MCALMTTLRYCTLVPFCHWNSEEFVSNSSCIPIPELDSLLEFINQAKQPLRLRAVYDYTPAVTLEHTCCYYSSYWSFEEILLHLSMAVLVSGIMSAVIWMVRKMLKKPGEEDEGVKKLRELAAQRVLMEQILAEQKEIRLEYEEILGGRNFSPRSL